MPSPQHDAIAEAMKAQASVTAGASIEDSRAGMEAMTADAPLPEGTTVTEIDAGGVPALDIRVPGSQEHRVVLYVHGGGYVIGSANSHRSLVARIARDSSARCLSLDYRLAPEHPFPAAVDDALAGYRHLLAPGVESSRIVIAATRRGAASRSRRSSRCAMRAIRCRRRACVIRRGPISRGSARATPMRPSTIR